MASVTSPTVDIAGSMLLMMTPLGHVVSSVQSIMHLDTVVVVDVVVHDDDVGLEFDNANSTQLAYAVSNTFGSRSVTVICWTLFS